MKKSSTKSTGGGSAPKAVAKSTATAGTKSKPNQRKSSSGDDATDNATLLSISLRWMKSLTLLLISNSILKN